eukprot:scaffold266382_cov30-Tisochrysis_lutea.AAC.9
MAALAIIGSAKREQLAVDSHGRGGLEADGSAEDLGPVDTALSRGVVSDRVDLPLVREPERVAESECDVRDTHPFQEALHRERREQRVAGGHTQLRRLVGAAH